jgi:hypothetical protein
MPFAIQPSDAAEACSERTITQLVDRPTAHCELVGAVDEFAVNLAGESLVQFESLRRGVDRGLTGEVQPALVEHEVHLGYWVVEVVRSRRNPITDVREDEAARASQWANAANA